MLNIVWDGHKISNADELYHTTWTAVDGVARLLAPLPGRVVAVNTDAIDEVGDALLF
jgi:glycine cleavage system H lipoate-binding protein